MGVYFVSNPTKEIAYFRCDMQAKALTKVGIISESLTYYDINNNTGELHERYSSFPVWVIQVPQDDQGLEFIRRAKAAGKVVGVEYDDNYFSLPPDNAVHIVDSKVEGGATKRDRVRKQCLRAADFITVTTPELKEEFAHFNKHIYVLPNCIDFEDVPKGKRKRKKLSIGLSATMNHRSNAMLVVPSLTSVAEKYPNVEIVVLGDLSIFDMLATSRKRHIPVVDLGDYYKTISQFDIGVIPLVDSTFNACKSELKGLQFGAYKIPFLASAVAPYERFAKDSNCPEILVRKESRWFPQLCELVESESLRREIGAKAHKLSHDRDINSNIGLWIDAYYDAVMRVSGPVSKEN